MAQILILGTIAAATAGCGPPSPGTLVVATTLPLAERVNLQAEFQKWLTSSPLEAGHPPVALSWLVLSPGDDVERLIGRRNPPDVLLFGGNAGLLERLANQERLTTLQADGTVRWCVFRDTRPAIQRLADPRTDSVARAWALAGLEPVRWRENYARLVELAANEPRIGWRPEAEQAVPAGAGILRSTREPALAREFVRFLIETRRAEPATGRTSTEATPDPQVESLMADLLGATLVDAQDELWTAWNRLQTAGSPEPARAWLTEPPPWPPASIEKYLRREGENAMSLIETLAAELSPQPPARAWLIRSWLSPPRIVEPALLTEMARAADGSLIREPRFRAWLRAEWTASARQRYRRVTRVVARTDTASIVN